MQAGTNRDIIKAFSIETCMGFRGCPNAVFTEKSFPKDVETVLSKINFDRLFKERIKGAFRKHNRITISVSCCPNACSRPQIADIGFIGAVSPKITDNPCSYCGICQKACGEDAVMLKEGNGPVIKSDKCLHCGICQKSCPEGKIISGKKGLRILIGGKLGRHPALAGEMPGIYGPEKAIKIIEKALLLLLKNDKGAKKMADLFNLYDKKILFEMLIL